MRYTVSFPPKSGIDALTADAHDLVDLGEQIAAHTAEALDHMPFAIQLSHDAGVIARASDTSSPIHFDIAAVDPTPCCPDSECGGQPCTFPGYADNH